VVGHPGAEETPVLFKGNQPPKRHQVRIRSLSGQRTVTVRYVRLDDVRITDVDGDAGTITVQPEDGSDLQVGESSFDAEVARSMDVVVSLNGLSDRRRQRVLRAAESATGGDPVSLVLDARRGRLG
jgi:hypothetical protein